METNKTAIRIECLTMAGVLLVMLTVQGGCSDTRHNTADSGNTPLDSLVPDGKLQDLPAAGEKGVTDELRALVKPLVEPLVDPATALTDASKTVGLVVAVVGAQKSGVYGFGATSASGKTVPDGDTIYQIGSISKALTGLVLARAVTGTGGVTKAALVESYLPALKGSNGTKNVTLGMLVSHHAGLETMPTNLPKKDPFSPAAGYTLAALKTYLFGLKTPVAAGKAYKYSNTSIGLLGLALQKQMKVSGYHDLLQKTLAQDLGIKDVWGEVARMEASTAKRVATGYAPARGKRVQGHFSQMGVLASAGETVTTGNAMLVLLLAFTGQKSGALDKAITESLKPIKPAAGGDQIAYGIEVQPDAKGPGPIYKKSGVTAGGYTAFLAFRRSPRVGVAVMTNVASFKGAKTMAMAILDKLTKAR